MFLISIFVFTHKFTRLKGQRRHARGQEDLKNLLCFLAFQPMLRLGRQNLEIVNIMTKNLRPNWIRI